MSAVFRIILILMCFGTCWYTLRKIRKSQIQIEDSLFWIIIPIVLFIISLFPNIADILSNILGIGATVNFIFLAMIFILLIKVFLLSIKLSQLEYRLKNLVQFIAIKNNLTEKELKEIEKNVRKES